MPAATPTTTRTPHLVSALIALALAAAIVSGGRAVAVHLERTTLPATAPELFSIKSQGVAFQRAVAQAPNVLLLYGSSELIRPIPVKSADFFRTAPTGFQVAPIGNQGTTLLNIIQSCAALGADLHDKKIAISISPVWFAVPAINPHFYEGNFSLLAASKTVFGDALDFELKRAVAVRMLQFPQTLTKSPVLRLAVMRLASGTWLDRVVFCALLPLGKMENAVLDLQDHFEALLYVLRKAGPASPRRREVLDWSKLVVDAGKIHAPYVAKQDEADVGPICEDGDAAFLACMDSARDWTDLNLLLRELAQIHVHPLLLSMPMYGQHYDQVGVSRSARQVYYDKIRALAHQYGLPLRTFEDHDGDTAFLIGNHYHLSAKGWIFYNHALDDFYHGQAPGGL
jgi:D-alanine transfer protein